MSAHEITDRKLYELEKQIQLIYDRHKMEITETLKEYIRTLEPKIQKLVQRYLKGELTDSQLQSQMVLLLIADKRYKESTAAIAENITDVSEEAFDLIPAVEDEVYEINYREEEEGVKEDYAGAAALLAALAVIPALKVHSALNRKHEKRYCLKNIRKAIESNLRISVISKVKVAASYYVAPKNGDLEQKMTRDFVDDVAERSVDGAVRKSARSTRSIARTRLTWAENKAKQVLYNVLDFFGVEGEKTWYTVGDERVRDSHRDMDGVTVPFTEPFIVGGFEMMFPADDSGGAPPSQYYNCRCYMRRSRT